MISVIVLSCNDAEYARDCIDSIKDKTEVDVEIILVNNGCNKENTMILEQITVDKYLKSNKNIGVPAGYNYGIREAMLNNPTHICLMNADTKVETEGWIKNMLKVFEEKDDAGIVAAMTNKIANKKQNWNSYDRKLPNKIIEASWVGFGMALIPIKVINEIGLLDDKMGLGAGVDVEYSLRMHKYGYKNYVDGFTFVWHKGKVAFDQLEVSYKDLQRKNIPYIKQKYPNTWRRVLK